ncbi:ATP-binding protein [Candidatus Pacearchaeota archaeon]|nr:ATP-binding protein [Candidatus Pacearchaeota archaeon]
MPKKSSSIGDYLSLAIKLILILSILNAIYSQFWHIMSTNIFLLILMFVPQIFKKYKLKIPREFEWLLLVFVILTFFLGEIGGKIIPIFFGIATGMIGFMILLILYSSNQIKKNYFLIILFSFNFSVAIGFLIELAKFYLKLILGHELHTGIYAFTMMNMTYVIIGAAIASVFGYIYMKRKVKVFNRIVDKFKRTNPKLFTKTDSPEEILEIIKKGENAKTEFKSTLRVNLHTNELDRRLEYSVLKTLTALLNSNGGTLLIGVANNGKIIGIERDRFENNDRFNLHLMNLIKAKIGKKYLSFISFEQVLIEGKTVLKIDCRRSNEQVFLRPTPQDEEFYIRAGPSTIRISGSELIGYVGDRFRKEG